MESVQVLYKSYSLFTNLVWAKLAVKLRYVLVCRTCTGCLQHALLAETRGEPTKRRHWRIKQTQKPEHVLTADDTRTIARSLSIVDFNDNIHCEALLRQKAT